jgi:hypothetical protein
MPPLHKQRLLVLVWMKGQVPEKATKPQGWLFDRAWFFLANLLHWCAKELSVADPGCVEEHHRLAREELRLKEILAGATVESLWYLGDKLD